MARDTIMRILNPRHDTWNGCTIGSRGCMIRVRVADTVLMDGLLEIVLDPLVDYPGSIWKKDFGSVHGGDFYVPLPLSKLEFGRSYVITATFSPELYQAKDSVHFHYTGGAGQSRPSLSIEEVGIFFRRRM